MTVRHYTGFWLKDAITTAACILGIGTTLSACKDSDSGIQAAPVALAENTPAEEKELSLESVIDNLNEQLDQASGQLQEAVKPHAEEIHRQTKEEVDKLFRWEYRVVELPSSASVAKMEQELSVLGEEGWECVSFVQVGERTRVTCKRRPPSAIAYLKYIPGL